MIRAMLPVLVLQILVSPACADKVPTCIGATTYCAPLVACIPATGEVLRGVSLGRNSGPIQAQSEAGVRCEGTWRRTLLGTGLAEFTCTDGRSGKSSFRWFERETGTAVGTGTFSTGDKAQFWAGNNLERYFREMPPEEMLRLSCKKLAS